MPFGQVLREFRQKRGLTQEELAERARLSARAISDLERGTNQSARSTTVRLLVDALGLEPDEADQLRAAAARSRESSLGPSKGAPHNLPGELTSFVGREQEVSRLKQRLLNVRLLSLTGAGGIGKTRLALRLARETLSLHSDGVWLVELGSVSDPVLVPRVVASVLSVHEQPGRPLVASICDALKDRALLLVLDNCEHLVAACAEFCDHLLRGCQAVRILATSREPLAVPGEVAWPIAALSLPDATATREDHLLESEAVQLFIDRAAVAAPAFAAAAQDLDIVGRICRQLDGIPLAIELAAARVSVLDVAEIAVRLDHRFELLTFGPRTAPLRQQTLRATVNWSYNLLSGAEQTLLARASVFAGGWTLDAAEAVCAGDGVASNEVLDHLGRLVAKSLVVKTAQRAESRYQLLETIRAFAREQLVQGGTHPQTSERHAGYYLRIAEEWMAMAVAGPDRAPWLDRMERDHANFRQALGWAVGTNAE